MQSIPSISLRQNLPQPQLIHQLHTFAEKRGVQLYLVGGSVRALLLNQSITDLDFALADNAIVFAKAFADKIGEAFVRLEEQPPTARIVIRETRLTLDFAGFRAETLEADLRLRDLTINAMALDLSSLLAKPAVNLIDPCGGFCDLKEQTLRFASEGVVIDDPLRLLRVYRFAAQLGFEIPEPTIDLIRRHRNRLPQVSSERIRDELIKILTVQNAAPYLRHMAETRLLSEIIPEIEELGQNTLDHSLFGLEMFETEPTPDPLLSYQPQIEAYLCEELIYDLCRRQILKLAILLHKGGTEMAVRIMNRLRLGRKAAQLMRCLVQNHLSLMALIDTDDQIERRTTIRFLRDTGDDWLGVLLLFYANLRSSQENIHKTDEMMKQIADLYHYEIGPIIERGKLITGDDILRTFGMMPGPKIGRILRHVEDLQFEGQIRTPEEALEAARTFLESCGT
ncbi:CCA tRNA nucleotidyltransferase [Candidatus Poribacteria bacterium]|nr:CCA tRNA nucleotidyltransferase [Candidatus Poribacteria bacterium]